MGWFTRKPNTMTARVRELSAEIATLEIEIHQLNNAADLSDPHQIQSVLEEMRILHSSSLLKTEEELAEPAAGEPMRDCSSLYNDQGLRKFDLAGWWLRAKHPEPPPTTKNEQLVTLIATGRHHGHTALRRDTRLARNRFVLLTLVLLAVLWSILSLLIPQL